MVELLELPGVPLVEPLMLPLAEPLVPAPALPFVLGLAELELEELRSAPEEELDGVDEELELEPSRLGVFTLMSALVLLELERSVLAPEEESPEGAALEDEELAPGVLGVTEDEDDELDGGVEGVEGDVAPGRLDAPLVELLLSPQALSAAATAPTITNFAKVRIVLSI